MFDSITAVPAYGRDYKSKAAVLHAWHEGVDFQCAVSGRYMSIRDFPQDRTPWVWVWIRYANLRKTMRVN
jgi:hypothetical protein